MQIIQTDAYRIQVSVLFIAEFDHDYRSENNPQSPEGSLGNPGYKYASTTLPSDD